MSDNSSTTQPQLTKREALRRQQAQEENSRAIRRVLAAAFGLIALLVVAVLIIMVSQALGRQTPAAQKQLTPPNATASTGIALGGTQPHAGVPHLVIWSDYQCPGCAAREEAYGPVIDQLITDGFITAEIRTAFFLDAGLRNDSSSRAALAAAAADEVGAFDEFHSVVYANQPEQEGTGFTEQQLRVDFPTLAGIEGDDLVRFQELYDTRAFNDFTAQANQGFVDNQISETPTYLVGDQRLEFFDQATKTVLIEPTTGSLLKAIQAAADDE